MLFIKCFEKLCKIHKKIHLLEPFFDKVAGLCPVTILIKDFGTDLLFSGKFCAIFKNTYFVEHLRIVASERE